MIVCTQRPGTIAPPVVTRQSANSAGPVRSRQTNARSGLKRPSLSLYQNETDLQFHNGTGLKTCATSGGPPHQPFRVLVKLLSD